MARRLPRVAKLLLILSPVLLGTSLIIQGSVASAVDLHSSHDVVPEAVLEYGAAPLIGNVAAPNPLLALAQSATLGEWSGVQQWPLVAIHAAMLGDGRVIMWDRENEGTSSMRLWNPVTNTFTKIADPNGASVFCAGFEVLADGRVLLNGGHLNGDNYGIVGTNIYNPATGAWTSGGDMAQARWYPSTIVLGDGRLLTMGGSITPTTIATLPEIFNPATGLWTVRSQNVNQPNISLYPKLHLLPTGKVFWAYQGIRSKLFDPNTGIWTDVTPTNSSPPAFTTVQYLPGKIMSAGRGTNTAVIDMNQSPAAWRVTQPMTYSRHNLNLTVLPDGKVLAVGGSNNNTNSTASAVLPAELWDPNTETWTLLPAMATPRMYHSMAMLLPDGRVVVAGGGRAGTQINYLNAEFYSPAYLFRGSRPTITYAPSQAPYGSNVTVLTPDANNIASAVLIKNPSVTHAYNASQRYVPLNFTRNDTGRLTVQIPNNANLVPPGFYMLFLLDNNGVPAVAPIIRIAANATLPPAPTMTPPVAAPTATNTPSPTPSLTPSNTPHGPVTSQTITLQVGAGANDVNDNGTFDASGNPMWIGNGGALNGLTGLRFTNVPIPRGATITSARLEVFSTTSQWVNFGLQFAAEAADNSAAFAANNRPGARALTTARVNHSSNVGWNAGTWYPMDNIAAVVQEVVNRGGWNSGGSLSIIIRGTSTGVWARKFLASYENNPANAPRLVVSFSSGQPVASSTPTDTPPPGTTPTFTLTPSNTPTFTPTFTPSFTPTPSDTPTFTPTPVPGAFPARPVLDNFNRANGAVGANWTGNPGTYAINSNQLNTINGHAWMFWSTPFGATQEVYVTLSAINSGAEEIDLLLKSQSSTTWGNGLMEVWYDPRNNRVQVVTFSPQQGWMDRGPAIPVTFAPGDRFGAKARADGFVEVYRNATLLATVDARGWNFAGSGGYVGVWVVNGQNTRMDDFGGG